MINQYKWPGRRSWLVIPVFAFLSSAGFYNTVVAQETQIRGFVHSEAGYRDSDKRVNFTLGEQDLFITSQLSDRISFLGETVFRYSVNSPTKFDLSIERIVMNFNYYRNHNVLFGKHHTPVNFWNDTYHHGRVFFPTIFRPMMFDQGIIPLHTTGVRFQGQNLGSLRFGYDVLIGNGQASDDAGDLNKGKSFMAGLNCKPVDKLKVGVSYYYDEIPKGVTLHHTALKSNRNVTQHLISGSVSYFANDFEFLGESTMAINKNDSTGSPVSYASYAYAGYRYKKFVPYVKAEYLDLNSKEVYFANHSQSNFLLGIRYEVNFLTVLKLEYAKTETHAKGAKTMTKWDSINFQFAIGF
jgi:hypothetical protein